MAEQTTAATHSLTGETAMLQNLVSQFLTRDPASPLRPGTAATPAKPRRAAA